MEILFTLKILALVVLTVYLIWHYAAKDVSIGIKLTVFISWFMTFSPIVVLPDDIYYVNKLIFFKIVISKRRRCLMMTQRVGRDT